MNLKNYLKEYVWLVILVATVLGFILPQLGPVLKPYLIYLLMTMMFFSCLGIRWRDIKVGIKNYKENLQILSVIHLVSPIIVLFFKPFFSEEIFLGLILATVMCSGLAVVFLSQLYGGYGGKALVMTSISNILSPLTVPLLVLLFARTSIEVDVFAMGYTILKLVIIPLILAGIIRQTRLNKPLSEQGTYVSVTVLFVIIIGLIAAVQSEILSNIQLSLVIAGLVAVLAIINFFIGILIGDNPKEKITYGVTASYKNFTLSTVLALTLFNPTVALPAIVYSVVNNLLLIPLQLFYVRKKKRA